MMVFKKIYKEIKYKLNSKTNIDYNLQNNLKENRYFIDYINMLISLCKIYVKIIFF